MTKPGALRATLAIRRVARLEIEAGTPAEVVIGALEAVRHGLDVQLRLAAGEVAGPVVYRAGAARKGRRG